MHASFTHMSRGLGWTETLRRSLSGKWDRYAPGSCPPHTDGVTGMSYTLVVCPQPPRCRGRSASGHIKMPDRVSISKVKSLPVITSMTRRPKKLVLLGHVINNTSTR